jgi:hypothetical protein
MNWIRWRGPTLLCRPVLLRVPDLKEDLAGFVGCASQHGLRPAGLGKWQDHDDVGRAEAMNSGYFHDSFLLCVTMHEHSPQ